MCGRPMIHLWIVGRLFFVTVFCRRYQPDLHGQDTDRTQNTHGRSY